MLLFVGVAHAQGDDAPCSLLPTLEGCTADDECNRGEGSESFFYLPDAKGGKNGEREVFGARESVEYECEGKEDDEGETAPVDTVALFNSAKKGLQAGKWSIASARPPKDGDDGILAARKGDEWASVTVANEDGDVTVEVTRIVPAEWAKLPPTAELAAKLEKEGRVSIYGIAESSYEKAVEPGDFTANEGLDAIVKLLKSKSAWKLRIEAKIDGGPTRVVFEKMNAEWAQRFVAYLVAKGADPKRLSIGQGTDHPEWSAARNERIDIVLVR